MKKFKFIINGSSYEVSVQETSKDVAEIEVNGTSFTVEIEKPDKDSPLIIKKPGIVDPIKVPEKTTSEATIKSPLPGSISKILVNEGQTVKRGDVLLTMESMKMENNIVAEEDGIVKKLHVQVGQTVMQDELLLDFESFVAATVEESAKLPTPEPKKETAQAVVEQPKAKPTPAGSNTVKSPLPGTVLSIAIKVGQSVKKGDKLLALESMKMENNILAEKDITIKAIHVSQGQSVMQDDPLIDFE